MEPIDSLADFGRRLRAWFDLLEARERGECVGTEAGAGLTPEQLEVFNQLLEERFNERTGQLRVLHDVSTMTNESRTIGEAIRRVLRRVAEYYKWSYGHVYVLSSADSETLIRANAYYEDHPGRFSELVKKSRRKRLPSDVGLFGRVLKTGESAWVEDVSLELEGRGIVLDSLEMHSAIAFPVKVAEHVMAIFEFLSERRLSPEEHVFTSMETIGTHLGLFIIRKRMERSIAELTILEHQRIGRDLHDDLGQQLTGLALLAKSLERDLRTESPGHAERALEIASGLKHAQTHIRHLARGLVPVEVEADGLMNALADLAITSTSRFGIEVSADCKDLADQLTSETATELYRITQEAVTNAAKHGKAKNVRIRLGGDEDGLLLEIQDDGVGVSEGTIRQLGIGMSTMRHRANIIGGELTIERSSRGGTLVRCSIAFD